MLIAVKSYLPENGSVLVSLANLMIYSKIKVRFFCKMERRGGYYLENRVTCCASIAVE